MPLTQQEQDLLNELETKCTSHFNIICEKVIKLFNDKFTDDQLRMIISGGRLMKYLTPPDKIFNVNYLEQEDPDTGKKLLKSYDTDVKMYVFEDILSINRESYNPNLILNYYRRTIIDNFFESLYFMNNILDFKLYYIEKILNDYDLTLYLPQGMSLKDLYDMRDKNQINKILKDHLVCSSDIIANSIPVIRLGFNIKKKSSNKILKLYFFDCSIYITINEEGNPWVPLQSLPVKFEYSLDAKYPTPARIEDLSIKIKQNIYFYNLIHTIIELNMLIHYGTNKYKNYKIKLPENTLKKYYKIKKTLFRLNYIKKLIENVDYNKGENYLSYLYIDKDYGINYSNYDDKLNKLIKRYLDNQYFPNDDGTESDKLLVKQNNIFTGTRLNYNKLIMNHENKNKAIINGLKLNILSSTNYDKLFTECEPFYKEDISFNQNNQQLNNYFNSTIRLYTDASKQMNLEVLKFQLMKDMTYIDKHYPSNDVEDDYTIIDFLNNLINLYKKLPALNEVLSKRDAENCYVVRGVGNFSFGRMYNVEDAKIGDTFTCLTPCSTSNNYNTGLNFFKRQNSECCFMIIKLQSNGKYIYTGNRNYYSKFNENEILLPPGTKFKFTNKRFLYDKNDNKFILVIEVDAIQPNFNNFLTALNGNDSSDNDNSSDSNDSGDSNSNSNDSGSDSGNSNSDDSILDENYFTELMINECCDESRGRRKSESRGRSVSKSRGRRKSESRGRRKSELRGRSVSELRGRSVSESRGSRKVSRSVSKSKGSRKGGFAGTKVISLPINKNNVSVKQLKSKKKLNSKLKSRKVLKSKSKSKKVNSKSKRYEDRFYITNDELLELIRLDLGGSKSEKKSENKSENLMGNIIEKFEKKINELKSDIKKMKIEKKEKDSLLSEVSSYNIFDYDFIKDLEYKSK